MTTASPESETWRVCGSGRFQWRSWADEFVVYDEVSGDTHLLDSITACALRKLQEQPASLGDLADHVTSHLSLQEPAELHDYLDDVLGKLHRLDLIEPVY
jgi:PqqD family protein of HPr-rel-A system